MHRLPRGGDRLAQAPTRVLLERAQKVRLGEARRLRFEGSGKQSIEIGRNRLLVTAMMFAFAFAVLGVRLFYVGLLHDGTEPRLARSAMPPRLQLDRADIVDRNGLLLATNLITPSLYADPKAIIDPDDAADRLIRVLPELGRSELRAKLASDRRFVWIKRGLTPEEQYEVNRLGIPGLYFQREQRRVYPNGPILAHVLGFTGVDNNGLAGIEKAFDDTLRERAETGEGPLQLSVDLRVQNILRQQLAAAMVEFKAKGGGALVLDVNTGEILGMVSLPDFDPNNVSAASKDALFNRVTLGVYEMGSIFKAFTAAMALDSGTVSIDGGYDASKPIRIARFTIRDSHPENRWLSVPEILIHSSNIGAAKMAVDVGAERQRQFLGKLGLLQPAAIELPEVGHPMAPARWREINTMTIGFGHGIAVSPLQTADAMAAMVNGGFKIPPTLLKRSSDVENLRERVITEKTSRQLREILRLVVEEGTAKKARVVGYRVGGKTGTAEKAGVGGYRHKALLSSFVGVFPMDDPKYLVLAMLDEPKGNASTYGYATAGWTAAPAVGAIISRIAPILGVEPRLPADGNPDEPPSLQPGGRYASTEQRHDDDAPIRLAQARIAAVMDRDLKPMPGVRHASY